jgi:hypothetical protein
MSSFSRRRRFSTGPEAASFMGGDPQSPAHRTPAPLLAAPMIVGVYVIAIASILRFSIPPERVASTA